MWKGGKLARNIIIGNQEIRKKKGMGILSRVPDFPINKPFI